MNDKTLVKNTNEISQKLLRGGTRILFLPTGCVDLDDSNHEPYLDCPSPESAICLSKGSINLVAIGLGGDCLPLLEGRENHMRFAPAARVGIRPEIKQICMHAFENLEGHPSQTCTLDFVEWLYDTRPTSLIAVMQYFLENPEPWLIGLPRGTASTCLLPQASIHADDAGATVWYPLSTFEFTKD